MGLVQLSKEKSLGKWVVMLKRKERLLKKKVREERNVMNKRSLWGILLIVIGVIWGLNALEITNIDIFFEGWWTLFIIVPSLLGLFDQDEEKTGNIIGLVLGVALLLVAQGVFRFELILKLMVPFILVMMGITVLVGDRFRGKVREKFKSSPNEELENIVAMFAEQKVNPNEEIFKGAVLDVVFGGITLDLQKAKLEKEVMIRASSIFGGITILVPEGVNVRVRATPIFGGMSNKVRNSKDSKKTIYIEGFCLFGGIDIK